MVEAKDILDDHWDPSVTSLICKNRKLYYKLKAYLEQPVQALSYQQEAFIESYGNIIASASEESLRAYFDGADGYEKDHIEDCWLLFNAGVTYGAETIENVYNRV